MAEVVTGGTLRRDAAANRAKLLEAARRVFAEAGLDAPLEAVAARAGVGIATLYRRFPTREDLIAALVGAELEEYLNALEEALAREDAWEGLVHYLGRTCQLQACSPGLCAVPFLTLPGYESLERAQARKQDLEARLVERARSQGVLRSDVTADDLALFSWANAGVVAKTSGSADAWRRYLELMLAAFRAA